MTSLKIDRDEMDDGIGLPPEDDHALAAWLILIFALLVILLFFYFAFTGQLYGTH